MTNEVRTDDAAPWKQRFRAPVTFAGLAKANPRRGLATSNRSGVFQIYAWDVTSGDLRQLTDRPEGKAFGCISPDGRFVYYLDAQHGNEIGHFVRVPFEGGAPEDVTPEMPPYSPVGAAAMLQEALNSPMAPIDELEYDRDVAAARPQLDAPAWETAGAEGRRMTLEQATAYALEGTC